MSNRDGYYQDLFLAFLLRGWMCLGLMAIFAMCLGACSPPTAKDILPSMSSDSLSLKGGETDETRSHIPQRGCDEKSDSSLRKPLL